MHGLFVEDMIHASTSDALCDQFVRAYQADYDIMLEDVIFSFLGMEIEHNKRDLTTYLDTYIQSTLTSVSHKKIQAEASAYVTRHYVGAG